LFSICRQGLQLKKLVGVDGATKAMRLEGGMHLFTGAAIVRGTVPLEESIGRSIKQTIIVEVVQLFSKLYSAFRPGVYSEICSDPKISRQEKDEREGS
jgi:hypothetical protein